MSRTTITALAATFAAHAVDLAKGHPNSRERDDDLIEPADKS